jgi:hypothetical protein
MRNARSLEAQPQINNAANAGKKAFFMKNPP